MELYYSRSHADEEGTVDFAKMMLLFGSREELFKICNFFRIVESHLKKHKNCHLHLRDNFKNWGSLKDFDIEVNLL